MPWEKRTEWPLLGNQHTRDDFEQVFRGEEESTLQKSRQSEPGSRSHGAEARALREVTLAVCLELGHGARTQVATSWRLCAH